MQNSTCLHRFRQLAAATDSLSNQYATNQIAQPRGAKSCDWFLTKRCWSAKIYVYDRHRRGSDRRLTSAQHPTSVTSS